MNLVGEIGGHHLIHPLLNQPANVGAVLILCVLIGSLDAVEVLRQLNHLTVNDFHAQFQSALRQVEKLGQKAEGSLRRALILFLATGDQTSFFRHILQMDSFIVTQLPTIQRFQSIYSDLF